MNRWVLLHLCFIAMTLVIFATAKTEGALIISAVGFLVNAIGTAIAWSDK